MRDAGVLRANIRCSQAALTRLPCAFGQAVEARTLEGGGVSVVAKQVDLLRTTIFAGLVESKAASIAETAARCTIDLRINPANVAESVACFLFPNWNALISAMVQGNTPLLEQAGRYRSDPDT